MRVSGKKSALVVAAATVAIWAFVESSSAQTTGNIGGNSAAKSSTGAAVPMDMGAPPTPASVLAHKKAYDAMTTIHDLPPTAADRKAAAAMSK